VVTDVSGNGDTPPSQSRALDIKFAAASRVFFIDGSTVITGDSGNLHADRHHQHHRHQGKRQRHGMSARSRRNLPSLTINGDAGNDT